MSAYERRLFEKYDPEIAQEMIDEIRRDLPLYHKGRDIAIALGAVAKSRVWTGWRMPPFSIHQDLGERMGFLDEFKVRTYNGVAKKIGCTVEVFTIEVVEGLILPDEASLVDRLPVERVFFEPIGLPELPGAALVKLANLR